MAVTTKGIPPERFYDDEYVRLLSLTNRAAALVVEKVTQATPVGVSGGGGGLRGSWVLSPATKRNPVASVGNSKKYLIPVELGRKPGSGISREGQKAVTLWARRKLGMGAKEAESFAFLLSRKYKLQGRLAQGFLGLAKEGDKAPNNLPTELDPVRGGLLADVFTQIDRLFSE